MKHWELALRDIKKSVFLPKVSHIDFPTVMEIGGIRMAALLRAFAPPNFLARSDIVAEFIDNPPSLWITLAPLLIGAIVSNSACWNGFYHFNLALSPLVLCLTAAWESKSIYALPREVSGIPIFLSFSLRPAKRLRYQGCRQCQRTCIGSVLRACQVFAQL